LVVRVFGANPFAPLPPPRKTGGLAEQRKTVQKKKKKSNFIHPLCKYQCVPTRQTAQ